MSVSNASASSKGSSMESASDKTPSLNKFAAAATIRDVGNQALELEQRARNMAEASRNEAELARNAALEGQKEALHQLQREHRSRKDITEHKDALLRELEAARIKLTDLSDKVMQLEVTIHAAQEEKAVAHQHRDIADSAREGALAAKRKAYKDLDKERLMKEQLHENLTKAKQQLETLGGKYEQEKQANAAKGQQVTALTAQLEKGRHRLTDAENQLDKLSERTDELKDALKETERKLSTAEDKNEQLTTQLKATLEATERTVEDTSASAGKDRNRCKKAEIEVQEALKEIGRADKRSQLAELLSEDMRRSLDLERNLMKQTAAERDRMQQLLVEQQQLTQQLDRKLAEANECLDITRSQLQEAVSAEQDASCVAASLSGDRFNREELMDELQERLRDAESGRRVAESSWREAEESRQDAQQARREAERNWHQLSELLERAESARKDAIGSLLSERSSRLMIQQTLEVACQGQSKNDLEHKARRTLLADLKSEQTSLSYLESVLSDVNVQQRTVIKELTTLDAQLADNEDALLYRQGPGSQCSDATRSMYRKLRTATAQAEAAAEHAMASLSRASDTTAQARAHHKASQNDMSGHDDLSAENSDWALAQVVPGVLDEVINSHCNSDSGLAAGDSLLSDSGYSELSPDMHPLGDISNATHRHPASPKGYRQMDDDEEEDNESDVSSSIMFSDDDYENGRQSSPLKTPDSDMDLPCLAMSRMF